MKIRSHGNLRRLFVMAYFFGTFTFVCLQGLNAHAEKVPMARPPSDQIMFGLTTSALTGLETDDPFGPGERRWACYSTEEEDHELWCPKGQVCMGYQKGKCKDTGEECYNNITGNKFCEPSQSCEGYVQGFCSNRATQCHSQGQGSADCMSDEQ
jgi:hypothetical protein